MRHGDCRILEPDTINPLPPPRRPQPLCKCFPKESQKGSKKGSVFCLWRKKKTCHAFLHITCYMTGGGGEDGLEKIMRGGGGRLGLHPVPSLRSRVVTKGGVACAVRKVGHFALPYLVRVPMLRYGSSMGHNAPKDVSWSLRWVYMMRRIRDDCIPPPILFLPCACVLPSGHGLVRVPLHPQRVGGWVGGWVGGPEAKNKVCVPVIGLKFPAPLINHLEEGC